MPLIQYERKNFSPEATRLIAVANGIINDYSKKGFELTLRQLYYQFVARDIIANNVKEYNKLGDLISNARMAGFIDWFAIVDRTRNLMAIRHFDRPSKAVQSALDSYSISKWDGQDTYVEVWVEKDALKGIVARACDSLDTPYFSCRGYTSQSEMWAASQRLLEKQHAGKRVQIIHLGDHDPSGIDMTRDIQERLSVFTYNAVPVNRIALNMDQVEEFNPPPNPAKVTDSRYESYRKLYGEESWELDAIEPTRMVTLIEEEIKKFIDQPKWEESLKNERRGKETLKSICMYFPDVVAFLKERRLKDDSPIVCKDCGATEANPRCLCIDQGDIKGTLG